MFLDMKTAELVLQLGSHVEMVFKATNLQEIISGGQLCGLK